MPKINQEEYEFLKELGSKWEWIARDGFTGIVNVYKDKPRKIGLVKEWTPMGDRANKTIFKGNLFQFIQWEGEGPYNIAELIEEYEIENGMRYNFGKMKLVDIDTSKLATRNGYIYVKESEETEVKKDKKWAQKEVDRYLSYEGVNEARNALTFAKGVINQLDEPEVLSQEWIDKHAEHHEYIGYAGVPVDDLQNLLVPKQELPVIPQFVADKLEQSKADGIHSVGVIFHGALNREYDEFLNNWILNNEKLFVEAFFAYPNIEVEEEQKYYVVKSEGLDGVHYYFVKFDDEMTGLFTLPNDKKGAYRFDDKEKAQAIANYTDNKVEELEE